MAGEEVDSSTEPKSPRSRSMCPIPSSAMSTDVSTMTRISNRLYVGNKFLGCLLEHADSMLAAQPASRSLSREGRESGGKRRRGA